MTKLVFHVDDSRNLRGGERQVLYLAAELEKLGCTNRIVCRSGSPLDREAQGRGIETIHLPFLFEGDPVSVGRLAREVKNAVARLGLESLPILHAHTGHAAAAVQAAGRKAPSLRIVHRRVDFRLPKKASSTRKYAGADIVIALSKAIETILVGAGIDGSKIRVIPSAVDLAAFGGSPNPDFKERLFRDFGIPSASLLIGSLMAMVPHKDPLNLVAAAEMAVRADKRCHFLIAGEGPLLQEARTMVKKLGVEGHVHLPGQREDNADLLRVFDLFVLSSREEGLGSALLEAMACGLPLVGTDAGGIPELIEDGRNGFVVPKENPAALAGAILRLAGDAELRARTGKASLEMSRRYSTERMAQATIAVYEEALRNRS
jgi:glycosyltransferase involved in cell wall biosynthesis